MRYKISLDYYGGFDNYLVGTGQGNKFSGNLCRGIYYLIIRDIEKRNLEIQFNNPIYQINHQVVSVSFVNDMDLVSNRENTENNMQQILDRYNYLHTATRGYIEQNKTKFFSWQ